jgi:hypothetical protein
VDRRPIPAHIGAVVHAQIIELTEVTLLTTTPTVVNFAAPIHSGFLVIRKGRTLR